MPGFPAAPAVVYDEYLEIGGVALATPAWAILDLTTMWEEAAQRGSDRLLPGAAGVKANKRRRTVTRKALPMVILGHVDQAGTPQADHRAGLWANIAYLKTNVVAPTGTGDGTRTAVLHAPGATTRTGPVHVLDLKLTPLGPTAMRGVLEISIPAGVLL